MSGLDITKENIKRKLSLEDYPVASLPQNGKKAKKQNSEKVKVTIYLTEKHSEIFNKICIEQMKKTGKLDRSKVICDSLDLYYQHMGMHE